MVCVGLAVGVPLVFCTRRVAASLIGSLPASLAEPIGWGGGDNRGCASRCISTSAPRDEGRSDGRPDNPVSALALFCQLPTYRTKKDKFGRVRHGSTQNPNNSHGVNPGHI